LYLFFYLHAVAKGTYRSKASTGQPTDRNHGSKPASFLSPRISPEQVDRSPPLLDIQFTATYSIPRLSSNITLVDKLFWPNPIRFARNFLRPKTCVSFFEWSFCDYFI